MSHVPFAIVVLADGAATVVPDTVFTERQRAALTHIIQTRGVDALPPTPAPAAPPVPSPADKVVQASTARAQGYTGDSCTQCHGFKVKRNGSCTVCEDCGATTGCS